MNSVIINATSKHTATVIFLHGLGDTGHGWSQMFQMIRQPHIKYVCPTANTIPVTLNMGMRMPSWFDIKGLSPDSNEDECGIKQASQHLESLITAEEEQGIARSSILIGGFSQGAAVALYTAMTSPKSPLAGILALSTWMPLAKSFPQAFSGNKDTPILQCHGDSDSVVSRQFGELTAQLLKTYNSKHDFKLYKGMDHSSCDEEMKDAKEFIMKCLPAAG